MYYQFNFKFKNKVFEIKHPNFLRFFHIFLTFIIIFFLIFFLYKQYFYSQLVRKITTAINMLIIFILTC